MDEPWSATFLAEAAQLDARIEELHPGRARAPSRGMSVSSAHSGTIEQVAKSDPLVGRLSTRSHGRVSVSSDAELFSSVDSFTENYAKMVPRGNDASPPRRRSECKNRPLGVRKRVSRTP